MKSKFIGTVARRGGVYAASTALLVVLALFSLPSLLSAQTLQHRYSFVSDASDSVGGPSWNGTIVGAQGGTNVTINNGLELPGGGGQNFSGYVTLPAGILNTTTNVTVEFWATQNAARGWAELWTFNSGTPSYWAFITDGLNNNNNVEQALRLNNGETDSQSGVGMPGTETHYTVTFNASTLVDTIWQGKSTIASATVPSASYTPGAQNFTGCYIGQDPWPDPQWDGTLYEFRIYNGVLSQYEILVDDVAGPTNLVTSYTPVAVSLQPSSTNLVLTAAELPTVDGTFATSGTNVIVNVSAFATNWVSSNPSVLAVGTNGVITAVGYGNATLSATVAGVTATTPTIFVTAPQTLLHRYSFATDASDSVGGSQWAGTLVPPSTNAAALPATISNGLSLPGGGGGGYSGYLAFPSGILTNTTSLTVECWVTQNTANGWATIWDFANNGNQNFEMCPFPLRGINSLDVAVTPNGGEVDTLTGTPFPVGAEVYTAFTFNSASLTGSVYTNGVLIGAQAYPNATYIPGTIGIGTTNNGTIENWLGNDTYGDTEFQGTIYEFRIWNGVQPPLYLAASAAAGPSVVITNITLNALALNVGTTSMVGSQNQQATVAGNFDQVSGANLTSDATNWVSSNPSVLTVSQSGLISAVSGGTATVSATVNGTTATSPTITVATTSPMVSQYSSNVVAAVNDTVTLSVAAFGGSLNYQWSYNSTPISGATSSTLVVTNVGYSSAGTYSVLVSNTAGSTNVSEALTVVQAILKHRYSFVSDASDSVGGPAWKGTIVGASGGTAATIANGLVLPGGGGPGHSGYVTLPGGILTNTTSLTIECWVSQNNGNQWAQIFNFGNGQSQNMGLIALPNRDGGNMELGINPNSDELDTISSIHLPTNSEQEVAFTFNRGTLTSGIYDNGVNLGSRSFPNTTYIPGTVGGAGGTLNNVFGQDPYPDQQFQGTVYEFRIWDGAQSPLYLAVSAAAGPSILVTNLAPSAVSITVTNDSMLQGLSQPATATGNFPQISGAVVTSAATNWISSNPSVLTVNSSGIVTAVAQGTATISATVAGVTGTSATITVANVSPSYLQKPVNLSLVAYDTATFSVSATGGGLSYQWEFNGNPITGATGATLTLTNISLASAGTYTVVVNNNVGSTNTSATLAVTQAIIEHRYSFVSDASDSVGGANGTIVPPGNASGQPATIANGLSLPGHTSGGFNYSGYVLLPPGLLTNTTSITIETWVTQNSANTWATIWDFANNTSDNFELCPAPASGRNSGNMITAFEPSGSETDLNTADTFPNASEQYVTLTVNAASLVGTLYTNGIPAGTVTLPSSAYLPHNFGGSSGTVSNMLGNDIFGDDQFSGTINEFRIWYGAETPFYMTIATAAGPSIVVTNVNPTAVNITVNNNTMIQGNSQQAAVTANFVQLSGVTVTSYATNWISSNTGVLTVNSNGVVTAVGTGSATISATVAGVTGTTATITVPNSPPVITQQPQASDEFLQGATLTASVGNAGTPPFTYRWFFNSGATPISTSSNPGLTIPNVQSANQGTYTVVVSNLYGSVTSSGLVVTVVAPTPYDQSVMQYGPVGYWPLEEPNGPTAYDVIGGDNGTYTTTSVPGSAIGYSLSGPSQSFFGSSSYGVEFQSAIADIPVGPLNITGPVTVTAWVQEFVATQFASIVGHGDDSWRISLTENGSPNGGVPGGNDGSSQSDASATNNINDANWHLVTYTYNGNPGQANNGSLYLDGVLVASNTITATPAGDNLDVWIGGSPDYGTKRLMSDAGISHVAIFNQAFTPAQVNGLYNGTFVLGPQTIHIATSGANVVLTWQTGTLLESTNVFGPWTTNSPATSPYTLPATDKAQFFKLLVP